MALKTVKGYVFMHFDYLPDFSAKGWQPDVWTCKVDETDERIFIREIDIAVDVPDDFDPVPRQVAVLEKQKRDAMDAYQRQVTEINEKLSKLLSLTYEPEVA